MLPAFDVSSSGDCTFLLSKTFTLLLRVLCPISGLGLLGCNYTVVTGCKVLWVLVIT